MTGDEDRLIQYAVSFCERSHMNLEFFHVIQDMVPYASDGAYFPETMIASLSEEELRSEAEKKMNALIKNLDSEVVSSADVHIGWLEHCILRRVKEHDIDLLMVGKDKDYHSFFTRMTSSLKGLAQESSVPVIVVPKSYEKQLPRDPKILIPDSLSHNHKGVISAAFGVCDQMSQAHLCHVHVSDDFSKDIEMVPPDKFELVFEAISSGGDDQDFKDMVSSYIRNQMKERLENLRNSEDTDTDYEAILLFGEPNKEVQELQKMIEPDLVVMGVQPKSLWTKLFHHNRIPFAEQMAIEFPVLLVPEKYNQKSTKKAA